MVDGFRRLGARGISGGVKRTGGAGGEDKERSGTGAALTPQRRALGKVPPSMERAGIAEKELRKDTAIARRWTTLFAMDLQVALPHVITRNGQAAQRLASSEIAVSFVGSIEINDEGMRRRQVATVLIAPELATPFVQAILRGDEANAADEFQHAFAQSYGVGYVTISDVSQLEIGEASS